MMLTIDLPEQTLAALQADAEAQGRGVEQIAAEHLASLYARQDDEDTAINEALDELEAGQGRPLVEFAQEFSSRCANRDGIS